MRAITTTESAALLAWVNDSNGHTPAALMPLFYNCDAFLFELWSSFDMILQYIAAKHHIPLNVDQVKLGQNFWGLLAAADRDAHDVLEAAAKEWWFADLRTARHFITHHDRPALMIEYREEPPEVVLLSFGAPGMHQRRELFSQCDQWGANMSRLFKELR
jgi:hypothetical protein